jgi:hypothetical protein
MFEILVYLNMNYNTNIEATNHTVSVRFLNPFKYEVIENGKKTTFKRKRICKLKLKK